MKMPDLAKLKVYWKKGLYATRVLPFLGEAGMMIKETKVRELVQNRQGTGCSPSHTTKWKYHHLHHTTLSHAAPTIVSTLRTLLRTCSPRPTTGTMWPFHFALPIFGGQNNTGPSILAQECTRYTFKIDTIDVWPDFQVQKQHQVKSRHEVASKASTMLQSGRPSRGQCCPLPKAKGP